jgi:hypothetical protein
MRINSQQTLIGLLRDTVTTWRTRMGWSRETVVQEIVAAHEQLGVQDRIGIRFDPQTRDPYDRCKVNADRVFRWLDDESKDNALLPTNFIPSLLAALPADLRLQLVEALLAPFGLVVRTLNSEAAGVLQVPTALASVLKEDSESHLALTGLMHNGSADALRRAFREVSESVTAKQAILRDIEGALAAIEPTTEARTA